MTEAQPIDPLELIVLDNLLIGCVAIFGEDLVSIKGSNSIDNVHIHSHLYT